MATLPSPDYVRNLSISGEFAAVTDSTIIDLRDEEVAPLYSAQDVQTHTQWTRVVGLHVAHILHVLLKLEAANGDWGALAATSNRALQGVGSRGKAVGSLNPEDVNDLLKIPSAYNARLQPLLDTFPPSLFTTFGTAGISPSVFGGLP